MLTTWLCMLLVPLNTEVEVLPVVSLPFLIALWLPIPKDTDRIYSHMTVM